MLSSVKSDMYFILSILILADVTRRSILGPNDGRRTGIFRCPWGRGLVHLFPECLNVLNGTREREIITIRSGYARRA